MSPGGMIRPERFTTSTRACGKDGSKGIDEILDGFKLKRAGQRWQADSAKAEPSFENQKVQSRCRNEVFVTLRVKFYR